MLVRFLLLVGSHRYTLFLDRDTTFHFCQPTYLTVRAHRRLRRLALITLEQVPHLYRILHSLHHSQRCKRHASENNTHSLPPLTTKDPLICLGCLNVGIVDDVETKSFEMRISRASVLLFLCHSNDGGRFSPVLAWVGLKMWK